MRELRLELPRPHPAQREVIEEAKRFNTVCCGRRWGKTVLGLDRLIASALKGAPTSWWAPSYRTLQDVWREANNTLAPVIIDKSESEHRLQLTGGGTVEFWSTDAAGDSARGRKYGVAVVDEAAMVANLEQFWQATLRPMLADLRGAAWFLSTPKGLNYFKTLFDRGQDPQRTDWASWHMPTASNPFIDPAEIEAARQDMSEMSFAQEFLAQFVSWEGQVFRRILEAATAPEGVEREDGHVYACGVDWGRSQDYTVFCVLDCTTRTMVALDRSRGVDYQLQRGRLRALVERFAPSIYTVAEGNSIGQPIIEQLWRDGMRIGTFNTTNATKARIIEGLALALERGELRILPDPVLLAELQSFRAEILPSGLTRYSAPEGSHDDCVIALAIALAVADELKVQQQKPPRRMYLNPAGPGLTSERPDFDRMQISPY
jgi:hypothetical protein